MNIARPDARGTVAAATVPLLVIAGADDLLCPAERYAAAAAGPLGELNTVAGAGHWLPFEAPEVVADAILRASASA